MLVGFFAAVKGLAAALLSREMRIAESRAVKSMMVGLKNKECEIDSVGGDASYRKLNGNRSIGAIKRY